VKILILAGFDRWQ